MTTSAPRPYELPLNHPDYRPRDFAQAPYTRQEARVAALFAAQGVGVGDDPVGALIACYEFGVEL